MKQIKGTVRKSEIEGGIWVLETKKGDVYQLKDGPVDLYQNGKHVNIRGKVRKDILGIGMVGPIFEVHEVS
ncbi:MAG: hypothetical protein K8T10_02940 [Candidatus Eremiobacteraeota bacterium]|nr:hypothetical protein [Candidatus Eremiobacteraeota bacterium]